MSSFVGSKALHLSEMTQLFSKNNKNFEKKISVNIPDGFVVTTSAFRNACAASSSSSSSILDDDHVVVEPEKLQIPENLQKQIISAWKTQLDGENNLCVVRSSSVVEDSISESYAGQFDSFLGISTQEELLLSVRKCWRSAFSYRVKSYHNQHYRGMEVEIDDLAVIVQLQVVNDDDDVTASCSGVMFTADPISCRRDLVSIEIASKSSGVEKLCSGSISPSKRYTYSKETKKSVCTTTAKNDNNEVSLSDFQVEQIALIGCFLEKYYQNHPQDIEFVFVSSKSNNNNKLYLLQCRPVTTLFSIPKQQQQYDANNNNDYNRLRVFVSFNHGQGTLDAISPLGIDVYRCAYPFYREKTTNRSRVLVAGGNRLWYDLTDAFRLKIGRMILMRFISLGDPCIAARVKKVLERDDEISNCSSGHPLQVTTFQFLVSFFKFWFWILVEIFYLMFLNIYATPESVCEEVEKDFQKKISEVQEECETFQNSCSANVVPCFSKRLKRCEYFISSSFSHAATVLPKYQESALLSFSLLKWFFLLGEQKQKEKEREKVTNLLNSLRSGLYGNVTTELDLHLSDIADVTVDCEEAMKFISKYSSATSSDNNRKANCEEFFLELEKLNNKKFVEVVSSFFDRFGSRAITEIDISVPRFRETPQYIISLIRDRINLNKKNEVEIGVVGKRRREFQLLAEKAKLAEETLLSSYSSSRFSCFPKMIIRKLIRNVRSYSQIREAPKFYFIRVLWYVRQFFLEFSKYLLKQQQQEEVETASTTTRTTRRITIIKDEDDIFFLTLDELIHIATIIEDFKKEEQNENHESSIFSTSSSSSLQWVREKIEIRRIEFEQNKKLKPPRVMTSTGEVIEAPILVQEIHDEKKNDDVSERFLGTAVSSGIVEGIAKVVLDLKQIGSNDDTTTTDNNNTILVLPHSDPAWTTIFSSSVGLILEVGGLNSHGAIIARELNLPAVAGIDNVTNKIKTGTKVRIVVDGSCGDFGVVEVLK